MPLLIDRSHILLLFLAVTLVCLSCSRPESKQTYDNESQREISSDDAKLIAEETVLMASAALMKTLSDKIQNDGLESAIHYCNLKATYITDSISILYGADIKRTSLFYRNPANAPTEEEQIFLNRYQDLLNQGEATSFMMIESHDSYQYFSPIRVQEMCLNCHGLPNRIRASEIISTLYPNDLATGYLAGDLRGMWSISIKKLK